MINNPQHNVICQIPQKVSVQTVRQKQSTSSRFFTYLGLFPCSIDSEIETNQNQAPFTLRENQCESEIGVVAYVTGNQQPRTSFYLK